MPTRLTVRVRASQVVASPSWPAVAGETPSWPGPVFIQVPVTDWPM
jgi:hypothetical protein